MNHDTPGETVDTGAETLFGDDPNAARSTERPPAVTAVRVQRPERHQVQVQMLSLDEQLEAEHEARIVWAFAERADLGKLRARIKAREGVSGRPPIDPAILLGLWLYATLRGVSSARRLDELCKTCLPYQWLCGGVSVNYHTLSDFRCDHPELLDDLLTESVAKLVDEGLVTLDRVAHDGVRVRANAGAASFRRKPTLEECRQEAKAQVKELRRRSQEEPGGGSAREKAARERAARERLERVERAAKAVNEVEAKKNPDEKKKARASTTDPEARVMKMPDAGYRPAFNGQFATDTKSQVITGVDVTNVGSDRDQLEGMVQQQYDHYDQAPDETLVDGGFVNHEQIERVSNPPFNCKVYAPPAKKRKKKDQSKDGKSHDGEAASPDEAEPDEYTVRKSDTPAVAEWRQRMATDEAKEIYKERAATAECVNALARNRGLQQLPVRGLKKVRAVLLWYALAHNLMRAHKLRAQAAAA